MADILPEGVVNVVLGRGDSVGNALINHPKVNMISITGDVATGKKVLQAAAKSVKRTHLELGGKAPVIVFDDADIDAVVNGLRAFGYYNAGQDCTAACRIYAGTKIYDKLVADLIVRRLDRSSYNQQDDTENEIGPLISQAPARPRRVLRRARLRTEAHRDHHRRQARATARLLLPADRRRRRAAGRRDRAPRGVRAGRLGHPLLRCRRGGRLGERQRLRPRLIGLDQGRVAARWQTAARLQYGCTWINTHFMLTNEMPHGGLKQSGYGKDMSVYALEDYTAVRHVMIAHG